MNMEANPTTVKPPKVERPPNMAIFDSEVHALATDLVGVVRVKGMLRLLLNSILLICCFGRGQNVGSYLDDCQLFNMPKLLLATLVHSFK